MWPIATLDRANLTCDQDIARLNTNLEAFVVEFRESNRLATEALRALPTQAIPSPGDSPR